MDFVNNTTCNAAFLNTGLDEDRLLGCVIARPTYRIEHEQLVPTPDEPWPIDAAPMQTPAGPFPGDMPFLTGGVDVYVVGHAYQPDGRTHQSVRVDIRVGGEFHRAIEVFGDRTWRKEDGALRPSDPLPFESMPLTYEHAFGGKLQLEEGEYAFPANAAGKGYYMSPEQAEGQPLPNLEDPDHLITSPEDHPDPVGTAPYPAEGSLRAMNAVDLDLTEGRERLVQIKPLYFNHAHPRMIIDPARAPRPGDLVEVTNVTPGGALRFAMPDEPMHAHVRLEDRHWVFPLHLDQVGILADDQRVFLSYRVVFRYRMVRFERRVTTLHPGALPAEVPASYLEVREEAAAP